MNFAHPSVLWSIAALVPLLAAFLLWSWRTRRRLIREFVPQRLQSTLTLGLSPRRALGRAILITAALATLLVALARPRLGAGAVEVRQRGLDIVIAVDTSRSMLAEDAGPGISRLQRARLAALDLARLARRDRLGLVAFAGTAFLQCPLTIDDEAFRQSVDALDSGIIPQGGTALGPAINTALTAFGTERDNVRVLVLFTDGEEHEPGALDAAARAGERGLRVFTVGVGSAAGELIRVRDAQGAAGYLKDDQGNVVKSSLNEPLLREIASRTGGFYLPLQGPRVMEELFTRGLEPLPRADLASRVLEQFHERFQWPLALALVLLTWETLLPDRARTRRTSRAVRLDHPTMNPTATANVGSTGSLHLLPALALPLALTLAATLTASRHAAASPASALRQYRDGDFESALQEYERLARSRPNDPRYRFNAGSAAYRAGDYTNAIEQFQRALASPDLRLQRDGYYNLGNSQFRIGEASSEHATRRAAWENAIRNFESAIKLDPADPRARQNLEYVRHQLENLKNQPQDPSGKQDKKDSQNQDQDQDKKEKSENQKDEKQDPSEDSKDQPQDSPDDKQSQQDQKQPKPDDSQQDPKDQEQDSPSDGADEKPGEEKKDQASKPDDTDGPKEQPQPAGQEPDGDSAPQDAGDQAPAGQMTPKQALRLLDTSKGEEKLMPLDKRKARSRAIKDW